MFTMKIDGADVANAYIATSPTLTLGRDESRPNRALWAMHRCCERLKCETVNEGVKTVFIVIS
jgi:hypothetical protein